MKNLIIVGDSFSASSAGWPQMLADKLGLNLICKGSGGWAWWHVRQKLRIIGKPVLEDSEYVIVCHTNPERINTTEIVNTGTADYLNPKTELDNAVTLFYKYLHNEEFNLWAQENWFNEVSIMMQNCKLINLFSFAVPAEHSGNLKGINVYPDLCQLSMRESASKRWLGSGKRVNEVLLNDKRLNHLSLENNQILADQLYEILQQQYSHRPVNLDIERFLND